MDHLTLDTGRPRARPACAIADPRALAATGRDDCLIDQVVEELNRMHRETAFELALSIGRLIVDRFYAGDLAVWRRRCGKDASFRKLAARAGRDLRATATTLYRAVAVYELTERLGISTWQHLSVCHLRAVLGLPDHHQRQLLATADLARWTTRRLEAEARRLRGSYPGKRGRPPLPRFARTIHQLAAVLFDRDAACDPDDALGMGQGELQQLARVLGRVQATVADLERQLAARIRRA